MKIVLVISVVLILLGTIRGHLLRINNTNSTDELRFLQCPEGATFQPCGKECDNSCDKNCNNDGCVFGCFCGEGLIKVDEKCVPKGEYCSKRICAAEGETWKELGTICDNQCPGEDCDPSVVTEGCFCPIGTSRVSEAKFTACMPLKCDFTTTTESSTEFTTTEVDDFHSTTTVQD